MNSGPVTALPDVTVSKFVEDCKQSRDYRGRTWSEELLESEAKAFINTERDKLLATQAELQYLA